MSGKSSTGDRFVSLIACALGGLALWFGTVLISGLFLMARFSFDVSWDAFWNSTPVGGNTDSMRFMFKIGMWGFLVVPAVGAVAGFLFGAEPVYAYLREQLSQWDDERQQSRGRILVWMIVFAAIFFAFMLLGPAS